MFFRVVKDFFSLVKFSHSIFAMPFAMIGMFLAHYIEGLSFRLDKLAFVILCMIFARNAAMAFNRYLDRDIDGKNPRTISREIPAGIISAKGALFFVVANCFLFVLTTYFINSLCLYLSPVALFVILFYSYTKRFTALCHIVLGVGLALAPIGAYLAVAGTFHWVPVIYGVAVLFWVAGFDIIYAMQDVSFDVSQNLKSVPVILGKKNALMLSTIFHVICGGLLVYAGWLLQGIHSGIGYLHWTAVIIFVTMLVYQHTLVKPHDLKKVDLAFFTTNGIASLVFGILVILDFYI